MTDDKIIEAVARALDPYLTDQFTSNGRKRATAAAIVAFKRALAEDGFVIHRWHDWVYPEGWHASRLIRPYCRRCGVQMGGILDAASCVPGEATADRKERE